VSAHLSAKTSFEMMFMLPQMTDVHYPVSIHVQLPTGINARMSVIVCSHHINTMTWDCKVSVTWIGKKCRLSSNTMIVARAYYSRVAMPNSALLR
jgi:hypothetical protein